MKTVNPAIKEPLTEEQEKLVMNNVKLAYYILTHNFSNIVKAWDDSWNSIAEIGLIKAAKTWDDTKEVKFATYASRCITNEILMAIRRRKKHSPSIPVSVFERSHIAGNMSAAHGGDSSEMDFFELFGEEDPDPTEYEDLRYALTHAHLTLLDQKMLEAIQKGQTQKECAKELGISQSYVSRAMGKAIAKLKAYMQRQLKKEVS